MRSILLALLFFSCLCHAQLPATADPGFKVPSVWNAYEKQIDDMALQPDGKLVIATSQNIDGWVRTIERLNADGSLDTSFQIRTSPLLQGFLCPIIVLPDGDILVGDNFDLGGVTKGMVRLNPDGSIDPAFNYPTALDSYEIRCMAIQNDGKILIGGSFPQSVMRLNPNGTVDATFANLTDYLIEPLAIVLQPDGKILVAGDISIVFPEQVFADLVRLNSDGTLDLTMTPPGGPGFISAIALQPDGKILVGGNFDSIGDSLQRSLARLHPDGSLDTTFVPTLFPDSTIRTIVVRPDANILIGGMFQYTQRSNIMLMLPNGSPSDTFFKNSGNPYLGINMQANDYSGVSRILQQPDGKIIHCGNYGECCTIYDSTNISRLLGTNYYVVNGVTKLDSQINGCDTNDQGFSFLKYKLVNGSNESFYYSAQDGRHGVFLSNGTSVITPILFNPSWFSVSPPSITLSMPSAVNYYNQNFCVTPVGIHHDIEVSLVPMDNPVPGNEIQYIVKVMNNGNQAESGAVSFGYEEDVADYVTTTPEASSLNAGQAVWDFGPLQPLSELQFQIRLHLNTPSSATPLNAGDILSSNAVVTTAGDEITANNEVQLHQVVVNSLDPNDKTCLEGLSITPGQVGDYVHYLIHFENSGSWPAQNITITDLIDTAKYDIATLSPMGGSHPFTTRITAGNKAEFMFSNIFLGFGEDDNKGYVLFKIRTKSTLVAGDNFQNTADIIFDYNTAITTNTATTMVQEALGVPGHGRDAVTLYPIPAQTKLFILNPEHLNMMSASVYNILGQTVLQLPYSGDNSGIDISTLSAGSYFIHLDTAEGILVKQFIKM